MSIQDALHFIRRAREEGPRLPSGESHPLYLEDLVGEGARVGLHFAADDLRAAFERDWAMRWLRYGAGERQDER